MVKSKVRRQIAFGVETWQRLNELSEKMDTPISTLVNLGITWWMDYHEAFKKMPEMIKVVKELMEKENNLRELIKKYKSIERGNAEGGKG